MPAFSDSGPGQASGSGATSAGLTFIGFAKTSCTDSGSSSEGAIFKDRAEFAGTNKDGVEVVEGKNQDILTLVMSTAAN